MNKPNSDRFKIGAWISLDTKRKADLYRALTGKTLQDIYEAALRSYLDQELPLIEQNTHGGIFRAHNNG